ncbi:hypothetical protein L2E81_07620 [Planktothrix agardhii 1033]|nr:hypothetical protein [Planktothrix agardhii 1033]
MKSSIDYTIESANFFNKHFSQESLLNLNLSLVDDFHQILPSNITELDGNKLMFSLFPFLIKKEDKKYIEQVCLSMYKILEKVIDTFLHKKEPIFEFYKEYDWFIPFISKQGNYYQTLVRYDFMISDNGIFFYEFNGCLPGGMFLYDRLNNATLKPISRLLNREIATTFKTDDFSSLVLRLLNLHSLPPLIAFLYDDCKFNAELKFIQEELDLKGMGIESSHINDLNFFDKKIFLNGKNISLAYNKFFLNNLRFNGNRKEWIDCLTSEPYKSLITLQANFSLMHNLAQMTIVEDKSLFALLNNRESMQHFDNDEIDFISKHIPYTKVFRNLEKEDKIKFIQNRDQYILKKYYSQLGAGVYKGQYYSESEWINLLDKNHDQAILQKQIEPLKYSFFDPRHNQGYRYTKTHLSMSMYIVDGQCSGLIAHLLTPDGTKNLVQPVFEVI